MVEPFKDYYRILRVSPEAQPDEIKRAYRKRMKFFHPDRFLGDTERLATAEAETKEINEAYETLSDPQRRAQYNAIWTMFQAGPEVHRAVVQYQEQLNAARQQLNEVSAKLQKSAMKNARLQREIDSSRSQLEELRTKLREAEQNGSASAETAKWQAMAEGYEAQIQALLAVVNEGVEPEAEPDAKTAPVPAPEPLRATDSDAGGSRTAVSSIHRQAPATGVGPRLRAWLRKPFILPALGLLIVAFVLADFAVIRSYRAIALPPTEEAEVSAAGQRTSTISPAWEATRQQTVLPVATPSQAHASGAVLPPTPTAGPVVPTDSTKAVAVEQTPSARPSTPNSMAEEETRTVSSGPAAPVGTTDAAAGSKAKPPSPAVPRGRVLAERLRVRAGPSTSYPILEYLQQADWFEVLGKDGENPRWWLVRCPSDNTGWISTDAALVYVDGAAAASAIASPPALVPSQTPLPQQSAAAQSADVSVVGTASPTPVPALPKPTISRPTPTRSARVGWQLVADSALDFPDSRNERQWWYLYSDGRNNFDWREMDRRDGDCQRAPGEHPGRVCADVMATDAHGDISLQWKARRGGKYLVEWDGRIAAGTGEFLVYKHATQIASQGRGPTLPNSFVDDAIIDWEMFFFVLRANWGQPPEATYRVRVYRWDQAGG